MILDLSMSESMSVHLSSQLCLFPNYPYHHKGCCLRFQCNCSPGFEICSYTKGVIQESGQIWCVIYLPIDRPVSNDTKVVKW